MHKKFCNFILIFLFFTYSLLSPALLVGTLIKTPNGLVAIEDLKIGDLIITHETKESIVVAPIIYLHTKTADTIYTIKTNEYTIHACPNQKLYDPIQNKWIAAHDFTTDNNLIDCAGNHHLCIEVSIINNNNHVTLYEISLPPPHTFFVSPIHIRAHNFSIIMEFAFGQGAIVFEKIGLLALGGLIGLWYNRSNRDGPSNFNFGNNNSDNKPPKTPGEPDKVANMKGFFTLTAFGKKIKNYVEKTNKIVQGQSVYKVIRNCGNNLLRKGDQLYLDNLHKNHLEVFDRNGQFKNVLNLNGTQNATKQVAAYGRCLRW